MTAAMPQRRLRVVPSREARQRRIHAWRSRRRTDWLHTRIYPRGHFPDSTIRVAEWITTQRYDTETDSYVFSIDRCVIALHMPDKTVRRAKHRLIAAGAMVQVRRGQRRTGYSRVRIVL